MSFSMHNGIAGINYNNGEWLFAWKDGNFLEIGEIKGLKCSFPIRIYGSGGGYSWPLSVDRWQVIEQEESSKLAEGDDDKTDISAGSDDEAGRNPGFVLTRLSDDEDDAVIHDATEQGENQKNNNDNEKQKEDEAVNNNNGNADPTTATGIPNGNAGLAVASSASKGKKDSAESDEESEYAPVPEHLLPKQKRDRYKSVSKQQVHVYEDDKLIYIAGIGKCQVIRVKGKVLGLGNAVLQVEFALSAGGYDEEQVSSGFLLWRAHLRDISHDIHVDRITMFDGNLLAKGQSQFVHDPFSWKKHVMSRSVFVNGYQSASFSGSIRVGQEQPDVTSERHQAYLQGSAKTSRNPLFPYESHMFACTTEWDCKLDEEPVGIEPSEGEAAEGNDNAKTAEKVDAGCFSCFPSRSLSRNGNNVVNSSKSHLKPARSMALYGWLSQREQLGVVKLCEEGGSFGLIMSGECDGQLVHGDIFASVDGNSVPVYHSSWSTDWALVHLSSSRSRSKVSWNQGVRRAHPLSLGFYFDAVGQHCGARTIDPTTNTSPFPWPLNSWSTKYFKSQTKQEIEKNIDATSSLSLLSRKDTQATQSGRNLMAMLMMSSSKTVFSLERNASAMTMQVPPSPLVDMAINKSNEQSISSMPLNAASASRNPPQAVVHKANSMSNTNVSAVRKISDVDDIAKRLQQPNVQSILPINVFIIDDGYTEEKEWGDWKNLDTTRFPMPSLDTLSTRIEHSGMLPGLFMAPYAVDPRCSLIQKAYGDPEWVLRNQSPWSVVDGLGKPIRKKGKRQNGGDSSTVMSMFGFSRSPPQNETSSRTHVAAPASRLQRITMMSVKTETFLDPMESVARTEHQLVRRPPCNGGYLIIPRAVCSSMSRQNDLFVGGRWIHGLDSTHPGVIDHARKIILKATRELSFRFLKLDHLYSSILYDLTGRDAPNNRYDTTSSRAQAIYRALSQIRETAGEKTYLLLGGCPLGPAIGIADGMRITVDTDIEWMPKGSMKLPFLSKRNNTDIGNGNDNFTNSIDQTSAPCLMNQVRNCLTRISMHGRLWMNDLDSIVLRRMNSKLSDDELRGLITAFGLVGGSFTVSDEIAEIPFDRLRMLAKIVPPVFLPFTGHDIMISSMPSVFTQVFGSMDRDSEEDAGQIRPYLVLAACNFGPLSLPNQLRIKYDDIGLRNDMAYDCFEFWTQKYERIEAGKPKQKKWFVTDNVPVHSSRIYAFRPSSGVDHLQKCCYIGSNMHFTMGKEISSWIEQSKKLTITFNLPRMVDDGVIWVRIPCSSDKEGFKLRAQGSALRDNLIESIPVPKEISNICSIFRISVQLLEPTISINSQPSKTLNSNALLNNQPNYIGSIILDW